MKVYAVAYPFVIDEKNRTFSYYVSASKAKSDALDCYVTQEEYEDENNDVDHLSKQSAKLYEVEVQLKRSVISAIMNGDTPVPDTTKTLVSEFRYRRGKIVVTNAKTATEPENVG